MSSKTYKAKTCISVNVRLKSGKSKYITFTPQTLGTSIYTTANTDIQNALERHPRFGKSFNMVEEQAEAAPVAEQVSQEKEEIVKAFRCLDDAKEYLADKFGVSRTKLKTRAAAEETAKAHGERIEWKQ